MLPKFGLRPIGCDSSLPQGLHHLDDERSYDYLVDDRHHCSSEHNHVDHGSPADHDVNHRRTHDDNHHRCSPSDADVR